MVNIFRKIIAVILVVTAVFSISPMGAYASDTGSDPELYPEEFYWDKAGEDADNGYKAYSIEYGQPLIKPEDPSRYGFNFLGWKDWYTDQIVDISTQVMDSTKGRKFYASWEKTLFTVRFFIGDELVSEKTVKENDLISEPDITPPEGYTVKKWYGVPESVLTIAYFIPFRMPPCDVNCYAVCEANEYKAYFYVDGQLFTTVTNVYNQPFINPRLPEKEGYTFASWNPKLPEITPVGDQRFDAVFEANEYIATLMVDGKVYAEIPYTYGQKSITLPDVPKKEGYTGTWESYTLGIGGVTINAVYTPIEYIATILVDGEVYAEIPYFYGQKSITLPDVPKKEGYTGTWESYSLVVGGVEINAIYKPNEYKSYFYVDDELFTTVTNLYNEPFNVPRSPSKKGYTFIKWTPDIPRRTPLGDRSYYAEFKANEYTLTLRVDGNVYKEIQYTYDQKSIELPPVPQKEGYTGKWEDYSLAECGTTVNAVYTANHVKIVNIKDLKISYKEKAKLETEIYADEGTVYSIVYKSSDPETVSVDKDGNVKGLKNGKAVITAIVTDSHGSTATDSCTVTVKTTFLQWLIKIFLFGWIWY